jgi:hypothetical protein
MRRPSRTSAGLGRGQGRAQVKIGRGAGGAILPSVYTYPSNGDGGYTLREKFGYTPSPWDPFTRPPVLARPRPRRTREQRR